jgi:hypothetical protein
MKANAGWVVAGIVIGVAGVRALPEARAQERFIPAPSSCSSGQVLVYDGGDRVRCVEPRELRVVDSCGSGQFVVARDSSGHLGCVSPSSTDWGIEGLLPRCREGATLVSEGFGRWRCQSPR